MLLENLRVMCVPLLVLLVPACKSAEKPKEQATPAPVAMAPAPAAPVQVTKPASTSDEPVIALTAPEGWIAEQPSSGMRKAQFRLPHAESDSEDASLVVYYFGGQGGSREANLERWAGQFEQADGTDSNDAMRSTTRTVAGLEVCDVTLSGTYIAETAPGSGERVNKPAWRMLASIVETSEGPWYFKLVGPAATVSKWEASYATYIDSMRPARLE